MAVFVDEDVGERLFVVHHCTTFLVDEH